MASDLPAWAFGPVPRARPSPPLLCPCLPCILRMGSNQGARGTLECFPTWPRSEVTSGEAVFPYQAPERDRFGCWLARD